MFLYNLQPWEFQGKYPVLYSEYQVTMPEFFNYVFLSQGTFMLKHDVSNSRENYKITESSSTRGSDRYSITANIALHTWIATNVPALKAEGYTSTINNHIFKIEFQLSQYRFPNMPVKDIMGNWQTLSTELMKDEDFGAELVKSNSWLDEDLKPVLDNSKDALEKARKVYAYVRDRFTCTGNRGIGMSTSLRNINKNKNGYVSDINLLLTAMLKRQGIEANPVILSTRSHGNTHEYYPLINRFNYVVCEVVIDDKVYYLDASNASLGFNKLSTECYNGHERVVTPTTSKAIYLSADSLNEKKLTSVILRSEKPGEWKGHFSSNKGYYESISIRSKVKEGGEESFFKSIHSSYFGDWTISEQKIDRLEKLESPVKLTTILQSIRMRT